MIFATLEGREPVVVLVRGCLCGLLVAICRQFRTAQHAVASTHLPFFLPGVILDSYSSGLLDVAGQTKAGPGRFPPVR